MQCSIEETVYWYNMTPKNDATPLSETANRIYQYKQCVKGIDVTPSPPGIVDNPYQVETPNGQVSPNSAKDKLMEWSALRLY